MAIPPDEKKEPSLFPEESGLMSLVDLQKFLADELSEIDGESHFGRAFRPLTDGLGIGAPPPPKKPAAQPPMPRRQPPARPVTEPRRPVRMPAPDVHKIFEGFEEDPRVTPAPFTAPVRREPPPEPFLRPDPSAPLPRATPAPTPDSAAEAAVPKVQPPVLPQASFFRRLLAGILDQAFVLGVLSLVLLITSAVLSKEGGVLGKGLLANLNHPAYLRFAFLGFATIWMGYLVLGVGVLDLTFGMWVWGLRINYAAEGESPTLRKLMRILASFLLEALLIPAPLLGIRVNGRNLIDTLSGSYLYRTS